MYSLAAIAVPRDRLIEREDRAIAPLAIPTLLGLLGTGAAASIVMALGGRGLRTKALTDRLPGYAPRTVYRHANRLAEHGLVERQEARGVPSAVVYRLSDRGGRDFFRLLDSYATAALPRGPEGEIGESSWTSFGQLGEMWSCGWIEELSRGPRSPTELTEATPGMTFHQVNRRMHLLRARGLIVDTTGPGRGRRYELGPTTRRSMTLFALLGRWRGKYAVTGGQSGLAVAEMATLLRAAFSLVELPEFRGGRIKLGVAERNDNADGRDREALLIEIGREGALRYVDEPEGGSDAWALGTVNTWFSTLLDGSRGRMRIGGDPDLVEAFLTSLHEALWMRR